MNEIKIYYIYQVSVLTLILNFDFNLKSKVLIQIFHTLAGDIKINFKGKYI